LYKQKGGVKKVIISSLIKKIKSILRVLEIDMIETVSDAEEKEIPKDIEEKNIDRSLKKEPKKANPEGLKNILAVIDIDLDISSVKNSSIISVSGLVLDRDQNGWFITAKGTETKIYPYLLENLGYYIKKDINSDNVIFEPQLILS